MDNKLLFTINCKVDGEQSNLEIIPGPYAKEIFGDSPKWYDELGKRMMETWDCVVADHDWADGGDPSDTPDYLNYHVKMDGEKHEGVVYPTDDFLEMYGTFTDSKKREAINVMLNDLAQSLNHQLDEFHERAVKVTSSPLEEDMNAKIIKNYFTFMVGGSTDAGMDAVLIENTGFKQIREKLDDEGNKGFDRFTSSYVKKLNELTKEYLERIRILSNNC